MTATLFQIFFCTVSSVSEAFPRDVFSVCVFSLSLSLSLFLTRMRVCIVSFVKQAAQESVKPPVTTFQVCAQILSSAIVFFTRSGDKNSFVLLP